MTTSITLDRVADQSAPATCGKADRCLDMINSKHSQKTNDRQRQASETQSTRQIAKNAVRGGPKDPKKDKRVSVGRGQKG